MTSYLPFTSIVAQDDFKLCLLLNIIDPTIGGVLATGDKGTGKTTTVRALSQLMGNNFPFVNLPIGATEDRVLGSLDLEMLINHKKTVIEKGLLAKANKGFLYIDEVNLLSDYLMDVLLDASVSGGYYLEREGVSGWLDSRFCLVGTMNPEEGDLRPQLKDRFGLSVIISSPKDKEIRKQIAKQRLLFDVNSDAFYKAFEEKEILLKNRVEKAKEILDTIEIPEEIYDEIADLTIKSKVEGMRADIILLKASRAYAAYFNEKVVTKQMLYEIAPFVIQHRSNDFAPPNNQDQETENYTKPDNSETEHSDDLGLQSGNMSFQLPQNVKDNLKFSINNSFTESKVDFTNNLLLQSVPYQTKTKKSVSIVKTVINYLKTNKFKSVLRSGEKQSVINIIFLIDTSASMAIDKQIAYLKGLINKTISFYPRKKIAYALVALQKGTGNIIQSFTKDKKKLLQLTKELQTGGKTNLGIAFFSVYQLLKTVDVSTIQLFVLTDGKVNQGKGNPFSYAVQMYKTYLSKLSNTTIVDTEQGFVRLGKAKLLAETLHLKYLPMNLS